MENAIPPFYPPQPPSPSFRMAGFGKRWGAVLVDINVMVLCLGFIIYVVGPMFKNYVFDDAPVSFAGLATMIMLYFFGLPFLYILYCTLFECSRHQATPGKRAIGIKVTDRYGDRITFLHALGRNSAKMLSGLILYFGYLMAIWTPKKQALHDLIANTYVIINE